jgi:hypothetical protein
MTAATGGTGSQLGGSGGVGGSSSVAANGAPAGAPNNDAGGGGGGSAGYVYLHGVASCAKTSGTFTGNLQYGDACK